jgi:hypothetical protein
MVVLQFLPIQPITVVYYIILYTRLTVIYTVLLYIIVSDFIELHLQFPWLGGCHNHIRGKRSHRIAYYSNGPLFVPWLLSNSERLAPLGFFHFDTDGRYCTGPESSHRRWQARSVSARDRNEFSAVESARTTGRRCSLA